MKTNVVNNMIKRAIILCSNKILFKHTLLALKIRSIKSDIPGFPK